MTAWSCATLIARCSRRWLRGESAEVADRTPLVELIDPCRNSNKRIEALLVWELGRLCTERLRTLQYRSHANTIEALQSVIGSERLAKHPFCYAAFGESEIRSGQLEAAREHFSIALRLSRNPMERQFFEQRLHPCG